MKSSQHPQSKNIYLLGFISFFTDLAGQMVYPLIPDFLKSLHTGTTFIGIIEGIAEATASLFRGLSGKLSDQFKNRKLFLYLGYGLSTVVRTFLFFATTWLHILAFKFTDRLGKAIRTPSRDALIAASVAAEKRGKAFGLQRAMDKTGSLCGPLLAMLILYFFNSNYQMVFLLSTVPAFIALLIIPFLKDSQIIVQKNPSIESNEEKIGKEKLLHNKSFQWFLLANIIFALGNSSNAFLLLKAGDVGISLLWIPLLWTVYNLVCAISSYLFGNLSDKIGKRPLILFSFLYYTLVYVFFAFTNSIFVIWLLFAAYGVYYGLSEGIGKAYIADIIPAENRATAYGLMDTGIGLALLPASLLAGFVWDFAGSQWAFLTSALFSLMGFIIFASEKLFLKTKN